MVQLIDTYDGEQRYLCISGGNPDPEFETRLPIFPSLLCLDPVEVRHVTSADFPERMSVDVRPTSPYGTKGLLLVSTMNTDPVSDEVFPLLGRRIISGEAKWGGRTTQIFEESRYIPGYWEWTEAVISRCGNILKECSVYDAVYASLYSYVKDCSIMRAFLEAWCPLTNSLHTETSEFSLSLWDLHRLSGLPILGDLYDEAIPSFDDLEQLDSRGVREVPRACHFLLVAYHHLRQKFGGKGVTTQQWVEFWCKRSFVYVKPMKRRKDSYGRPKSTGNPSGNICSQPLIWTEDELRIFETLGVVSEERKRSTYISEFLSCWLCSFVLPETEDRLIRPGTFKIASWMTKGRSYSLAVPTLASIYRGLGSISTSAKPSYSASVFPAHYLYSWVAYYFDTHYKADPCPSGPKMTLYS